ncbi:MAG: transglycosylase SLT domain-containing protein [Magnetovibrio sp.]|nr:transglycosylase SLT domain-containing protein [Magnetovibrio sp.]
MRKHVQFALICFAGALMAAGGVRANSAQVIESTWELCERAVHAQERLDAIPSRLLTAVSRAESGRWNAEKRANIAWPWTVTTGGKGYFFDTRAEAVAEVEILRTRGVRNIDVGCMQINLHYHEDAFETVEAAFDPALNAAYGAKYLKAMRAKTGNWLQAAGAYHSTTPAPNRRYRAKILKLWNEARNLPAPPPEVSESAPSAEKRRRSDIDFARIERLNGAFRTRQNLAKAAAPQGGRVAEFRFRREQQIDGWRNARAGGLDLINAANMRRAELAAKKKREFAVFGNGDRDTLFAERRKLQLNDWRRKRVVPFKTSGN